VAELVEWCGYLPLAIALRAGVFSKHRAWTLGHLISSDGPWTQARHGTACPRRHGGTAPR